MVRDRGRLTKRCSRRKPSQLKASVCGPAGLNADSLRRSEDLSDRRTLSDFHTLRDTTYAMSAELSAVDSCAYLLLRTIEEPSDNELRLLIDEARAGGPPDAVPSILSPHILGARLVSHQHDCRVFEFLWSSYVAYGIRNESYVAGDAYEQASGRLFRRFTRSRFLDYVSLATFAGAEYPGPLKHMGIVCGNHIIDVVSTDEPTVRILSNGA